VAYNMRARRPERGRLVRCTLTPTWWRRRVHSGIMWAKLLASCLMNTERTASGVGT
jgi:hypothetical protein